MELGLIGLGRMGASMSRRWLGAGHTVVGYARRGGTVTDLVTGGAISSGATSLADLIARLTRPRIVWLMVPAALVDPTLDQIASLLDEDDVVVDGGNSYFRDDMGGPDDAVERLDPLFRALAPGVDAAPRTPGRTGSTSTAEHWYLHCGPSGSGHFAKMVHNGIEYGVMAAYAEGLNILRHADAGLEERGVDAETTPLREPELYRYRFDVAAVTEVWRRGSVMASWLLDLTSQALLQSPELEGFEGRVSDSGEGRWTSIAAIDVGAPAPVLTTALYSRFSSRGGADYADKVLSAMRLGFGGHLEPKPTGTGSTR